MSASDGKAALATARASRPDLIVLDLGLPELDGLDVARALRRDSSIPIVMLTGRGDEADKIAGLEIGADAYVRSRLVRRSSSRGSARSFEDGSTARHP